MPDMKTALSTVLSQWEQDEQKQISKEKPMAKHLFQTTNNVSRETFNYIKNNPNKTTAEVAKALDKRGFKEGSVTSICAQLSKQGQVLKDSYSKRLVAIGSEYQPLKPAKNYRSTTPVTRKVVKMVKRKDVPQDAGLAAIAPQEPATRKAALILLNEFDPHDLVNKLSVMQARQLYDLLKQIFGG